MLEGNCGLINMKKQKTIDVKVTQRDGTFGMAKEAIERDLRFAKSCHIEYKGTAATLKVGTDTLVCTIPAHSGWYKLDEYGLPFGEPSTKDDAEAGYFRRLRQAFGFMMQEGRMFNAAFTSLPNAVLTTATQKLGLTDAVEILDYAMSVAKQEALLGVIADLRGLTTEEKVKGKWHKVMSLAKFLKTVSKWEREAKID